MAKSDHCVLVEWCASVNWKFNELERSLIKWKLKLATLVLQSGEENKTWIYLSLKDIREESSDIVRLMNLIRSSLADKEPTSDYYKFGMDELKYFTYDWEFTFQPEIEKIFNQHEQLIDKKAKKSTGSLMDNQIALRQLEETWKENEKLMQFIHNNIYETRETVINIKEMADQNLHSIQKGQSEIEKAQTAQRTARNLKSLFLIVAVVSGFTVLTIFARLFRII